MIVAGLEKGFLNLWFAGLGVAAHFAVEQWALGKFGLAGPWVEAHFLVEQWAL